ncbi:hypothetical protein GCM10023074_61210 [Microbispora amethystogenes]|uniref:Uncharacterized protein n=1 Tax=Microbispora amethystogenes TaxID=1427754 RepID=A0ABQ4FJK8_9ACTN|nr:hypothetical protein Mam01_51730 [Microbispora amethystogenes]
MKVTASRLSSSSGPETGSRRSSRSAVMRRTVAAIAPRGRSARPAANQPRTVAAKAATANATREFTSRRRRCAACATWSGPGVPAGGPPPGAGGASAGPGKGEKRTRT